MLFGLGVCLALPGALPALAQEHREQPASGERTAVWATLTADEQESYGAAEHERKARREQRRAERRAGRSDGLLIPGDTCPEAVGGHILLPAIEAGSTTGQLDDYTYGAACGGFNASSGVGPDLAYLIVTMVTCDLEVELDPVANDLALWVVTDCDDAVGGCVGGDDSGGNGTAEVVTFTAQPFVEYFAVVDGFGGASDDYTLTIQEVTQTGCGLWPVELQRFRVD